ncbi:MAG: selenide, water dikinase SelD [Phycisphaerales bacterium]|nr:selenide, water dikinase SelD [Phycisphaerales bacterium]
MAQVLRQLKPVTHPDLLVGTSTFDDAGVFRIAPDLALVQTVDFFPPLVDDPYDFGRIAAANALSDIYAMGGTPLTALNIVGFPDQELDHGVLVEILRGGADVCAQADCVVVGGHSVRDAEVKFGLAVTGRVHPNRILTNAGARPGDRLILTKPLGSGVLTSAAKSGKIPAEALAEAICAMTTLNRAASETAVRIGANACTDVTGFGLVGHAFEMADGSNASIVIRAGNVPLLARTLDMARLGVLTRAAKSTREYLGDRLTVASGIEDALVGVLLDAQTSGGLLLSVLAENADRIISELRSAGAIWAVEIGEVVPVRQQRIYIEP